MDHTSDPAREAYRAWIGKHAVIAEPPRTLWHYTSAYGLQGIMDSEVLWATSTEFLNDSAELRYGRDLFLQIAAEVAQSASASTAAWIERLTDPVSGPLAPWLESNVELYVTCFCSRADLLSQWRAYGGGDTAGGYAIGFTPPGHVQAWMQGAKHELNLRQVVYVEDRQRSICEEILRDLVDYLDHDPADQDALDNFSKSFVDALAEVASWCKHSAFEEEQEWRFSYMRTTDPSQLPVHHRVASGLLVPFVKLALPSGVGARHDRLPISQIQCGPSTDPRRKEAGLRSLLSKTQAYDSVEVLSSRSPARI